jgi:hypothetical protein
MGRSRLWISALVAVFAMGAGVAIGFVAWGGSHPPRSSADRSPTTATSRPKVHASGSQEVAGCSASELSSSGGWQGATGSMLGAFTFANHGSTPCELDGYLMVNLLDQSGSPLQVELRDQEPSGLGPSSTTTNDGVVLSPGTEKAAQLFVQWVNWCGPQPSSLTVQVVLPDGSRVVVQPTGPSTHTWGVPRCDSQNSPSVLYLGEVEHG